MRKTYDLMVVGGGIAGCEAAWQAADLGASVLLVSMSLDQLNLPSYISALFPGWGEAGKMLDEVDGTLFGFALERSIMGHYEHPYDNKDILVFDKREFSLVSKEALEKKKGLDARQALIKATIFDGEIVAESVFGEELSARTAIFSPGSYVKGRVRTGNLALESGRYGDLAADELGESLLEAGVEMEPWRGMIPEVLDSRRIEKASWTKAAEIKGLIRSCVDHEGRAKRDESMGEEGEVYWRKNEGGAQLLLPVGRKTSEAYLLKEKNLPLEPETLASGETIRRETLQECLVMRTRGPFLPETVRFAGSFGGARGYLACMMDGRKKAVESLEESA